MTTKVADQTCLPIAKDGCILRLSKNLIGTAFFGAKKTLTQGEPQKQAKEDEGCYGHQNLSHLP